MPAIDSELALLLDHPDRKPKLLLVDDQPTNIQILYKVFAGDYQVFMATSGEQALTIAREQQPDLILLDVVMEGMDGHETCRQLKLDARCTDIPVIFVTSHNEASDETLGLSVGAVDFISKPIHPDVVKARVKTHLKLKLQSDLLRKLVFIDGLTGVFNRRYFDHRLSSEWLRAQRNHTALGLLLIDVDFFKRYNDLYGHQAGDDCLRKVAKALRQGVRRPADVVVRYGGEEFACLLPETDAEGALLVARQLESAVRTLGLPHGHAAEGGVVTVSIGVAVKTPAAHSTYDELLAEADKQLYRAKAAGRAQACAEVAVPG